ESSQKLKNHTFASMNAPQTLSHSETYFHDGRNFWYNEDFLDLMAKRWSLNRYKTMLDIGCGLCHWSKLLLPYLQPEAEVTAMDNDEVWAEGDEQIFDYFENRSSSLEFVKGDAHRLPFEDDSFDVVTCQTVLIHLKNPEKSLAEMKRVVKPNGIVICAEPNNLVQAILKDSVNRKESIEATTERFESSLSSEHLKQMDKKGHNSFGDLLAGTMTKLGFQNVKSYLNDKLTPILPPYDKPEQAAAISFYLNNAENEADELIKQQIENGTYFNGGGTMMYLVSGQK
ncbi:MAG: methyltransferase domain-containing protein, partial [Spirosomaceae bacterium]|nr:methyltransferase domain-containing protein [Spirosomataceae bacterium]